MLKKIAKFARKQLLKIDWIRREVEAYQLEQEKKQKNARFVQIMRCGQSIHMDESDGPDTNVVVDYVDGRMVGQKHIAPIIIRPFGMRRGK